MFKGKTSAHDIAALIIQLANKGYIAIVNDDTSKRHYSFKILKPYTGKNIIEKKLYDGLAHYADKENHLRISDLKNNFFDILDDINYELENGQLKSNMYLENYNSQIFNYISIVLSLISIYLIPSIFGLKIYGIIPALIAVAIISIILLPVKFFIKNKWIQAILNILIIGIGYLITINVVNIPYGMIYRANPLYHFIIPIALLATILPGIIFAYSSKRNIFGTTMLNQLNIFKENLIKADKIDLICVLKEDPNYFYKILPYAYTLDFNEIWFDKFNNIDIKQPSWFITNSVFDVETFGNGLNRTMNYTAEAITSVPKSLSSKKIFSN
mgnify:CR=1 FL=1